jgi:hypothetical protein
MQSPLTARRHGTRAFMVMRCQRILAGCCGIGTTPCRGTPAAAAVSATLAWMPEQPASQVIARTRRCGVHEVKLSA